ncbi:MAG: phenylacetate-CoA oxygenase/reductase subunit PaaK [Chitinophagaceae bacterium]
MATHFHRLTITDIRKETPDCISIAFDIPDALKQEYAFTQGQNITLKTIMGGEELRRSYSICSSPLDNELRVAVKKTTMGRFSTWANEQLKKGDVIDVLPPTGKFYTTLQPTQQKSYLAFAAGSGITPVISIIKTTLATEPQSSFTLVYGNRNRSSIIFKEQLEALKNQYTSRLAVHHILSREQTDTPINYGRIDADKCFQLDNKLIQVDKADEIFICGPEEMIFSVKDWLEQKGIDRKKVHFELFTTPGQKAEAVNLQVAANKSSDKTSQVSIKLDGVTFDLQIPFNGATILDAALEEGADLPFACKGGVCSTCKARLLEGKVEMDSNYALEDDEVAAGFILTCQSHPRSERIIVDFDVK